LASPFIGVPRGHWPAMVGGRAASPCGQSSSIVHQSGVVELKRMLVEKKVGKRE
jgi:hypothetical protein